MEEKYISIKQLADLVGVSRATINRYRANGDGPKETRVGRSTVRFAVSDVEAWLSDGFEVDAA